MADAPALGAGAAKAACRFDPDLAYQHPSAAWPSFGPPMSQQHDERADTRAGQHERADRLTPQSRNFILLAWPPKGRAQDLDHLGAGTTTAVTASQVPLRWVHFLGPKTLAHLWGN